MTSEESSPRKSDRSRVNNNTKRVEKSSHVNGGMFTTVSTPNEKIFRSRIQARSLWVLSTPVVKACGGGFRGEPSVSSIVPPGAGQGAGREEMSHSSKHPPIDMTRLPYPFGVVIHSRSVRLP